VDMRTRFFLVFQFFLAAALGFGQSNFAKGQELFMQNKPSEAAVYLENSIVEDPTHVEAFLFLGIVYEQMDRTDEAIAVYRQIMGSAGKLTANVTTNLGNAYFKKDAIAEAETMYTQALNADMVYALAYLGRANTRMKRNALMEAVSDYEKYLLLDPQSPQRKPIELLIYKIKSDYTEVERQVMVAGEMARLEELKQRLLDEVAASLQGAAGGGGGGGAGAGANVTVIREAAPIDPEEAARLEAERRRMIAEEVARLEAERKQRFLDEISASLHGAAGASKGLSTGAEDIEGYEGEFELE